MDISSITGFLLGFGLLYWALSTGGSLVAFWSPPSLVITLGGSIAAAMVSFPLSQLLTVPGMLRTLFFGYKAKPRDLVDTLVDLARKARREGLLALEEEAEALDDPFLTKGILLVVDGTDPELVRSILETEITYLEERHRVGRKVFEAMGSFSPAFGMMGTLIGLIQMLSQLDNPEAIGPGLAVALVTTFYGVLLANMVFLPIANKLKSHTEKEVLIKEMVLEGILSIQAGDNPRILREKLRAFFRVRERQESESQEETPVGDTRLSGGVAGE